MLDLNSTVGDLYKSPIGNDILTKVLIQSGLSKKLVTNPIVSRLKLKTVAALTGAKLGKGFFEDILRLVNFENDEPVISRDPISEKWWKEAVFYQIYPRSFCDSNADGIGDLKGIISKLDYLKDLGVDALWLSPIYDSPNDDNGYDIRNYEAIMEEFGTMEDFDELLSLAHEKGMKIIMDLVINHTSDEHEWFKKALEDPSSKYRDYYFFKESEDGNPPNNWKSFFSGSAWNKYPAPGMKNDEVYALHIFSKKQMDLNWGCEDLRNDVLEMINRWLDKGVDGFRMDVINFISKAGFENGNETIGEMMEFTGIENYFYGPKLHTYLRQIRKEAFDPHGAFSVGETPGLGMNMCRLVTGEERKELDMVFSFDHLETPGHTRMEDYEYDLNYLKDYLTDWTLHYGNNCWMSLFYNNHDNPRMISKVSKDAQYHRNLSILLLAIQMTMKGTPFIFQGDEMGLANYDFTSMEQITDVESKGYYEGLLSDKNRSKEDAFKIILAGTREHARVLLPWNEKLPDCHKGLSQKENPEITTVYKKLISLRHSDKTLVYGDFEVLLSEKDRFVYRRKAYAEKSKWNYIIDCNLSKKTCRSYEPGKKYTLIFDSDATGPEKSDFLAPYGVRIYKGEDM